MSINLILTGGLGNGTLAGSTSATVTRGYSISAFVAIASSIARAVTTKVTGNIPYIPTKTSVQ